MIILKIDNISGLLLRIDESGSPHSSSKHVTNLVSIEIPDTDKVQVIMKELKSLGAYNDKLYICPTYQIDILDQVKTSKKEVEKAILSQLEEDETAFYERISISSVRMYRVDKWIEDLMKEVTKLDLEPAFLPHDKIAEFMLKDYKEKVLTISMERNEAHFTVSYKGRVEETEIIKHNIYNIIRQNFYNLLVDENGAELKGEKLDEAIAKALSSVDVDGELTEGEIESPEVIRALMKLNDYYIKIADKHNIFAALVIGPLTHCSYFRSTEEVQVKTPSIKAEELKDLSEMRIGELKSFLFPIYDFELGMVSNSMINSKKAIKPPKNMVVQSGIEDVIALDDELEDDTGNFEHIDRKVQNTKPSKGRTDVIDLDDDDDGDESEEEIEDIEHRTASPKSSNTKTSTIIDDDNDGWDDVEDFTEEIQLDEDYQDEDYQDEDKPKKKGLFGGRSKKDKSKDKINQQKESKKKPSKKDRQIKQTEIPTEYSEEDYDELFTPPEQEPRQRAQRNTSRGKQQNNSRSKSRNKTVQNKAPKPKREGYKLSKKGWLAVIAGTIILLTAGVVWTLNPFGIRDSRVDSATQAQISGDTGNPTNTESGSGTPQEYVSNTNLTEKADFIKALMDKYSISVSGKPQEIVEPGQPPMLEVVFAGLEESRFEEFQKEVLAKFYANFDKTDKGISVRIGEKV